MNIIFALQFIFGTSLVGMLFIFLRNLPLLCEVEPLQVSKEASFSFRLRKEIKETSNKSSEKFHRWSEKILHKLRLNLLKIDNSLFSCLKKIRERKIKFFRKK